MKRTKKILQLLFWLPIAAALIVVAVFETNVILPGTLAGNGVTEYYVTMALELLTVAGLPLSLRLFKFPAVIRNLQADKADTQVLHRFAFVLSQASCLPIPFCITCLCRQPLVIWPSFVSSPWHSFSQVKDAARQNPQNCSYEAICCYRKL